MRQVASVTTDCLTSDIGRFIRRKKGSQGGNVAGFSQPWRDDVPLYGFGENRQAFHRFSHDHPGRYRSEEHTSELQSLMRISYAVFCLINKHTVHQIIFASN